MFMNRSALLAGVALGALLSTACARTDKTYTDTASGSLATETIRVAEVTMGKGMAPDKSILTKTDTFAPTDTIRASVRTTGTGTAARLSARWTFEDSIPVQEQSETITTNAEAFTEFHITKPTPWPKGKYKLTIMLNGKEVETESFTVK